MAKEFTREDDDLLAELGVEVETGNAVTRTPREERIVAGFEELQRFAQEQGRAPRHGEDRSSSIFQTWADLMLSSSRIIPRGAARYILRLKFGAGRARRTGPPAALRLLPGGTNFLTPTEPH